MSVAMKLPGCKEQATTPVPASASRRCSSAANSVLAS
jgi:hypothetical protein